MKHLRDFIHEILLSEKIRSKKSEGKKFNLQKFKSLEQPLQILEYARENLKSIGSGSSRQTFALTSRYALKVAKNRAGVGQNTKEIEFATDPQFEDFFATPRDFHSKYLWIICDLARPLTEKEFDGESVDSDDGYKFKKGFFRSEKYHQIADMHEKAGLPTSDLTDHNQWGKTPDGKIILIDYGLDYDVLRAFYWGALDQKEKRKQMGQFSEKEDVESFAQDLETRPQIRKAVEDVTQKIEDYVKKMRNSGREFLSYTEYLEFKSEILDIYDEWSDKDMNNLEKNLIRKVIERTLDHYY